MYVLYLEKIPFRSISLTTEKISAHAEEEDESDLIVEDYYRLIANFLMIIAENS